MSGVPGGCGMDDETLIRTLIAARFASLDWGPDRDADWAGFEEGFIPEAQLFGAKRPARACSAGAFADRLRRLRDNGVLDSFSPELAVCEVRAVGSVAVALAGCEMIQNGSEVTRQVAVFLLVKEPEGWRIAAQAWDVVDDIAAAFEAEEPGAG